ncbi:hypothetical protein [Botrimarina hoheduenensis]|uniref:Bacteriophage N4 adsorption protein B n=1 Tax=Botrimarina hoheduenensis TaxID=2528000 RepID=A0A5C5WEZ9_9BACT|nr:hypothetical protein [Botrimarina hoheduenensis]TWT48661.1 hypothetical protein Pla111_04360 [Botrimarina hoheduenensis]
MKPEIELLQSGAITPEQYIAAARRQEQETIPLGQLAIEEGHLSAREVFEILHTQRQESHQRFGDIAVRLGYLERSQVAMLLLRQLEQRRSMIDLLVEMGVVLSNQPFEIEGLPEQAYAAEPIEARPRALVGVGV